ncbi:MAG TPA: polysaccharide lyase family protein, partial [Verrucomicrobiae bacterium]|nr:polysaccharide lyase family protein [Verrucomicrobiae bacterium]
MKIYTHICLLGIFALLAETPALAGESYLLWQIGAPDHDDRELALGPNNYGDFAKDAVFVVGKSNPKYDWPYVQPGPADAWAGSRQHTFSIVFGLKETTASETCKLVFDLIDTHSQLPPELLLQINSQTFRKDLPAGAGDASLEGDPAKGKPCHFEIKFSSDLLEDGNNSITITTVAGSWLLYDAVGLEVPTSFHQSSVENFTVLHFVNAMQSLVEQDGKSLEPLTASVLHHGPPQEVSLQINGVETGKATITNGTQTIEALVPEVQQSREASFSVVSGDQTLATQKITLKPVRRWIVYVLMHSHTDIGYTDLQANIERKQANNVIHALDLIRQMKDYPADSRFK